MHFTEMKYERPDFSALEKEMKNYLQAFRNAGDIYAAEEAMNQVNRIRNYISTMSSLTHVRFTMNTADSFYAAEQDYFDEHSAKLEELTNNWYRELLQSKFAGQLKNKYGHQLFALAEVTVKTYTSAIAEDINEESRLRTKYTKLLSGARIQFDGKELSLSQLAPYASHVDREVRRGALEAKYDYFATHGAELDEIYDAMVKVRTRMARTLGYANFIQLGYDRLGRTGYGPADVAQFRQNIFENFVLLAQKFIAAQKDRLQLAELLYYDEPLKFKDGNPVPKGKEEELVTAARQMYTDMSPETAEFIAILFDRGLTDLTARKDKAGGGYCTFFPDYRLPFIFANFNGTQHDVEVLTHEIGHAFQMYMSRSFDIPEYWYPTLEACEIHSMSMEFLTYPYMDLFFKEDTEKFRQSHLADAIIFLPYAALVDEFQHEVYALPELSPKERRQMFRQCEKKYLPHRNYAGNDFLEQGGYWQQQSHIYGTPFYYIDYALAQICALQFYFKSRRDSDNAWQCYLKLCRAGGSLSFPELVALSGLFLPFDPAGSRKVAAEVRELAK